MDLLRHQIRSLRQRNSSGRWFVPEGLLVDLLTHSVVEALLRDHCQVELYTLTWMVDVVARRAHKVFATLILIKQEVQIGKFLEQYLHSDDQTLDSQLPLSITKLEETLSHSLAGEFEEQQWIFLAPVFNQRLLHRNIPVEFPLPFIDSRKLGEGGFGDVYQITIPAGHHNFEAMDSGQPARIVRKELRKELGDDDLWAEGGSDEHKVMSNLHHLRHPNIIQLLTSYTYGGVPSFLLPLAEHGDLEALLQKRHRPTQFKEDRIFYAALAGLSSALEALHDYKSDVLGKEMIGYHHDLKPKNVLVSGQKLILSDFGLSKLKIGETSRTPFRVGQGFYLAPECEDAADGYSKGFVSRASDVWSLGCILLEVLIFMVEGGVALARYRDERAVKNGFFTTRTFFAGQDINPAVERRLEQLAKSEHRAVRQMVAVIRGILIMKPEKRLKASEVTLSLRVVTYDIIHLDITESFQSVLWMIEDEDLRQQWSTYCGKAKDITTDDVTQPVFPTAKRLKAFTNHGTWEDLMKVADELLELIQSSQSAADSQSKIALALSELHSLISIQSSHDQEINSQALSGEQPVSATTDEEPRHLHQLRWENVGFVANTSAWGNIAFSKDDKLMAVEHEWQISILNLPSGLIHAKFEVPVAMQSAQRHFTKLLPSFEFSPDSKWLVVSWVKAVYAYYMEYRNHKGHLVYTFLTESATGKWSLAHPYGMSQIPIRIAAITPDSRYVALILQASKVDDSGRWREQLSIRRLAGDGPIVIGPFPLLWTDHTFHFSPDSRLIAIGCQKTSKSKKARYYTTIRFLEIKGAEITAQTKARLVILCPEKFAEVYEGPPEFGFESLLSVVRFKEPYERHRCPRIVFGERDNRWVAGIWFEEDSDFTLYDLHSNKILSSISLVSGPEPTLANQGVVFAQNLQFAAGKCRTDTKARKLVSSVIGRRNARVEDIIVISSAITGNALCRLEGPPVDFYSLSSMGKYIVVGVKDQVRVIPLSLT